MEVFALTVHSFNDLKKKEYYVNLILDLCSKSHSTLALSCTCAMELLFLANVIISLTVWS